MSSGVRDRALSVKSIVTAVRSTFANPFLSSRNRPSDLSLLELLPCCNFGVPRPLFGDADDPTNCVMRGWRDVAPAGASVFWKKFKILLFPFAEEVFVVDAGPLDGVDAFLTYDPAIARRGVEAKQWVG
jgi:hypothetical protein